MANPSVQHPDRSVRRHARRATLGPRHLPGAFQLDSLDFLDFLDGAFFAAADLAWRQKGVPLPVGLAWATTFVDAVVAWVFFRAALATEASQVLSAVAGATGFVLPESWRGLVPGVWAGGLAFDDRLPG